MYGEIKGGDGVDDGGAVGQDGKLPGHYWLEGLTGQQERFLADITADQFGNPPIILLWPEDSWAGYRAGDQVIVAAHVGETIEDVLKALEESCE